MYLLLLNDLEARPLSEPRFCRVSSHPAAAGRNPPAAAPVEHPRLTPLAGRHAQQDRLVAPQPVRVGPHLLERALGQPRQHLEQILQWTHLLDLAELPEKVLERELRLAHALGEAGRLLLVHA